MERIIGDPVSTAMWIMHAADDLDCINRCQQGIIEILGISETNDSSDDDGSFSWIPFQHKQHITISAPKGTVAIRSEIEVFRNFQTPEDGRLLANSLNRQGSSGSFIFDEATNTVTFCSYCAVIEWTDVALFFFSLRVAIAHINQIGTAKAITRWNQCEPATSARVKGEIQEDQFPYPDMQQLAYIAGIQVNTREAREIRARLEEFLENYAVSIPNVESEFVRGAESLDINYLIETNGFEGEYFAGQSAEVGQRFCEWSNFGWSVSTHIALPYFLHHEVIPSGFGTTQDAIDIANILNRVMFKAPIHPLGFGTFWANRDQVNYSFTIPHSIIEPLLYGINRFEIPQFLTELANPIFFERIIDLINHSVDGHKATARAIAEEDRLINVMRDRSNLEFVRVLPEEPSDEMDITWGFPTMILAVMGIFDFLNTQVTSFELTTSTEGFEVRERVRTGTSKGEGVLSSSDHYDVAFVEAALHDAMAKLDDSSLMPTFFWIPKSLPPKLHDAVERALKGLIRQYGQHVDLSQMVQELRLQPNPWIRALDEDESEVQVAPNPEASNELFTLLTQGDFVDFNVGLTQAFWRGALHYETGQLSDEEVLSEVQHLVNHVHDRIGGPPTK